MPSGSTALPARAVYRTRQVLHALSPKIDRDALAQAQTLLSPAEARIFFAMEKRDQRHGLSVMTTVRHRGQNNASLLKAALLHDCGKGSMPVWLRIAKVLSPNAVASAGRQDGNGWRGAAFRLTHHAEIGASLLADAGSDATTVSLVRGKAAPGLEALLATLLAADDES